VIRIESHEAREFLKRDGLPIYDPHAPFADRDQPAYGEHLTWTSSPSSSSS
jgi:hypothetical protein